MANHVRAVELYETAAEESHVRALNGLGHEYYTGRALPRNFVSRAGVGSTHNMVDKLRAGVEQS